MCQKREKENVKTISFRDPATCGAKYPANLLPHTTEEGFGCRILLPCRNYNNGAVVQLLSRPRSGATLPDPLPNIKEPYHPEKVHKKASAGRNSVANLVPSLFMPGRAAWRPRDYRPVRQHRIRRGGDPRARRDSLLATAAWPRPKTALFRSSLAGISARQLLVPAEAGFSWPPRVRTLPDPQS